MDYTFSCNGLILICLPLCMIFGAKQNRLNLSAEKYYSLVSAKINCTMVKQLKKMFGGPDDFLALETIQYF